MTDRLRERHFQQLTRTMEAATGIQLPPSKRVMIEGRLRKRVRALDLDSLDSYGVFLFEKAGFDSERAHLIDCVTTNKTDFFREPDHFTFLEKQGVPALLDLNDRRGRTLKIWSAAASTGAEAYTIAMVLASMRSAGLQMHFSILGTDISNEVLEQAARATYPMCMLSGIPQMMRQKYVMLPVSPKRQEFRIVPQLRQRVHFEKLNLMSAEYPFDRDVDVIFCRNVLIYFSQEGQKAVLRRLISHLRPGGYIILGHSESFALADKAGVTQVSQTVFARNTVSTLGKVA